MHNKTNMPITKSNIDELLTSHNSANILCNYMRRIEYLKMILKNMAFVPRYFEEKLFYLNLTKIQSISFPMTCFCDIPLSKVAMHIKNYGTYGIALDKKIHLNKDIQPIQYINESSDFCKIISHSFEELLGNNPELDDKYSFLYDCMLSTLLYIKPIYGIMERNANQSETLYFKDECEWRYIPTLPDDIPTILPQKHNNDNGRRFYSDALISHKETWLKFEVNDIKYIIVPDKEKADEIIRFIIDELKIKDFEKYQLISKIELAENFDRDLS